MPLSYVPAGTEFSLSNTTAGAQRDAHIYRLPNGNLFSTWFDAGFGATMARIFEPDGDPVGAEFQLPFVVDDLAPLVGGGFAATRSTPTLAEVQLLNASGQLVGGPIQLATSSAGLIKGTAVDALPFGHFIAFWEFESGGLTWQEYDSAGVTFGAQMHDLGGNASLRSSNPQVIGFTSGAYVIGYELDPPDDQIAGPFMSQLWFRTYDGSASHGLNREASLPVQSGHGIDWDFALLGGGTTYLVAYATSGGRSIIVERSDALGNPDTMIEVAGAADGIHSAPSIIAAGGGFVVAWTDTTPGDGDDSGTAIKAQFFDNFSRPVGPELLVNSSTAGDQSAPDLIVNANGGDVFVTWTTTASGDEDVHAQRLTLGTSSIATIDGTGNGETLTGTAIAEQINGLAGDDRLTGNGGNDILDGGDGNDFIVANLPGDGTDRLIGGKGDDFLIVDRNDSVIEYNEGGYDNVCANEDYRLGAGVYVEVLSTLDHHGTANINLTGNALHNIVIGNDGANILDGGDGLTTADRLAGMGGDDILIVHPGDVVDEQIGGGFDIVKATNDYQLTAGAEIEEIRVLEDIGGPTGLTTDPIDLTGNELGQRITGNLGVNRLDGGGGLDILIGLGGGDFYFVDTDDVVIEESGGGYDNVCARADYTLAAGLEIEVLSTYEHGRTDAINLTGNERDQVVLGNRGDNVLNGALGNDRIAGFGGDDTFFFNTALGATNLDTLVDMNAGDRIRLDHAIFSQIGVGALAAGAFVNGIAAGDADDRIIYDAATGRLWYDADGNGAAAAAVQFATIENHFALAAGDFQVI